ncbi:MAG: UDP-N-acetylmuramate dehydrogenase [Candidatus Nanopelagicales bacterium]
MREERQVPLSELTTLRLGGPTPTLVTIDQPDELVDYLHGQAQHHVLVMSGGSNLVVADAGVETPVVRVATKGVVEERVDTDVELIIAAGESWDALVLRTVDEGWSGIESLSGIPGSVGATPIQNVGAYGQEVSDVCRSVGVFDRVSGRSYRMSHAECSFGYRTSVFKHAPERYVVLDVQLRLTRSTSSQPVGYGELAQALSTKRGGTAPLHDVRATVLALRKAKGMVLDRADHDTWSVGSFFTNPIVASPDSLPHDAPRWPQPDGRLKTSAAWLIEQAGFTKGFGADVGRGAVRLSTKHTLALTNRGDGTTEELLTLARVIRDSVRQKFRVELHPEPTLVGVRL